VNIYPGQIEDLIPRIPGVSSEYQILLTRKNGRDSMTFRVEIEGAEDPTRKEKTEKALGKAFKDFIGVTVDVVGVKIGELPRSMKKTKRVIDEREL